MTADDGEEPSELEELAGYLHALGHPSRLELLQQLRYPRTMREMQLKPRRNETEGNPDRTISRTAVERHLTLLKAIGVVTSRPGQRDGRPVDEWLLQRAKLFQVLERLRDLAHLRPFESVDLSQTEHSTVSYPKRTVLTGPRLVVLSGPAEGNVRPLKTAGPVTVGRSPPSDIALDYDPYLSSQHFVVAPRDDGGFTVREMVGAKNGTFVNWSRIPSGASVPLASGDVIKAGRSLLVFQTDRANS